MRDRAALAGSEPAQFERAHGNALETHDLVPKSGQHAADLAVLALVEDDAQPLAVALLLERLHAPRLDVSLCKIDTREQLLNILAARLAGHLHEIALVDAEARVHEAIGQLAVV